MNKWLYGRFDNKYCPWRVQIRIIQELLWNSTSVNVTFWNIYKSSSVHKVKCVLIVKNTNIRYTRIEYLLKNVENKNNIFVKKTFKNYVYILLFLSRRFTHCSVVGDFKQLKPSLYVVPMNILFKQSLQNY